jgi:NTE family protein
VRGRLDAAIKDALLRCFEEAGEIRVLGKESFGSGMPGAITLDSPEASNWLQEQELEFDLTVIIPDEADSNLARQSIEEADEILFVAAGGDPALSALESYALETRGGQRCRLILLKTGSAPVPDAVDWFPPRPYRSIQTVDLQSPERMNRMALGILGKGNAVVATSRGVHAAAILGAFQALEAQNLPLVAHVAAGSAILPSGLLACGASFGDIETIFRELANPALWKRSSRVETGLYEPAPIDEFLVSALSKWGRARVERPFSAISHSVSENTAKAHCVGLLYGATRAGLTPPGILPPLILEDKTILLSGENETEAFIPAAKALTPSPVLVINPKAPPLGTTTMSYRQLTGVGLLRLTPFHAAVDKRVRLQTILGTARETTLPQARDAENLSIPIPAGITPMDWEDWSTVRDAAYDWTSRALEKRKKQET